MSEDDEWDSENFRADVQPKSGSIGLIANQWDGEDEEEEVKDSWDDPEEEEQDEKAKENEEPGNKAIQVKKPKKILSRIEEKERKLKEELLEKKLQRERELMGPVDVQAEKMRRQKLEEDADLEVAKHLLGDDILGGPVVNASDPVQDSISPPPVVRDTTVGHVIKISDPVINFNMGVNSPVLETKEDFERYKDYIVKQLDSATKNQHFPGFVEQLFHALCGHLSATELKKINTWVGNLHIDKLRIEQGSKSKKKSGKGKAKLKLDDDTDIYSSYNEDLYDDFM